MIVVCGELVASGRGRLLSVAIAERAAAGETSVEVVGIVPPGPDGDAIVLKFAAAGVGHAALLRTLTRPLEEADVELALRYLPDIDVVIAAELDSAIITAVAAGAVFTGATLVVLQQDRGTGSDAPVPLLPDSAVVIAAPASDPDGTFAGFVADFAVRLDGGAVAADAWAASVRAMAVDSVSQAPVGRSRAAAR